MTSEPSSAMLAAAARELVAKLEQGLREPGAESIPLTRDEAILAIGFIVAAAEQLDNE